MGANLVAIHDRHHHVQQDQVGQLAHTQGQGLRARGGRSDGVVVLEDMVQQLDIEDLVIHQQQGRFVRRICSHINDRLCAKTGQKASTANPQGCRLVVANARLCRLPCSDFVTIDDCQIVLGLPELDITGLKFG